MGVPAGGVSSLSSGALSGDGVVLRPRTVLLISLYFTPCLTFSL